MRASAKLFPKREKQVEKEKMITKLGEYNYLRLTDNNFDQLLYILAELKMQMIDDSEENKKIIIKINEEVGGIPPSTPFRDDDSVYIIPYSYNNIFDDKENNIDGFGLLDPISDTFIYCIDKDKRIKVENIQEFLSDKTFDIFKYKCKDKNIPKIIKEYSDQKYDGINYFYESITGKKYLSNDQIYFDEEFDHISVQDFYTNLGIEANSLMHEAREIMGRNRYFDVLSENKNWALPNGMTDSIVLKQDIDGYFLLDTVNNVRSQSYNDLERITDDIIKAISKK